MLPSDIEALYASGNGCDIDRSAFIGVRGDAGPSSLQQMEAQSNSDAMIYTCKVLSSQMQMMSSPISTLISLANCFS